MKKLNIVLLCVCVAPLFAVGADPNTYLSAVIEQMETPWPNNRTVNLVFHGDNVPAGFFYANAPDGSFKAPVVDTFNAYPHLLHVALKELYPNAIINVIITAKPGETSQQGDERFERDVLTHKPDVVMIDYGLNDRRIGRKESQKAWTSMIRKATQQNVRVILLTSTPDLNADPNSPQDMLYRQALQVRRLALFNDVGLADSYRQFVQYARRGVGLEELMTPDNHPNRRGHEVIAAELLKWFRPKTLPAKVD